MNKILTVEMAYRLKLPVLAQKSSSSGAGRIQPALAARSSAVERPSQQSVLWLD